MINVYIDVDGVINELNAIANSLDVADAPRQQTGWLGEWARVRADGFDVFHARELITALNDLTTLPGLTCKWLTTWEEAAAESLSPVVGLNGANWQVLTGAENDDVWAWWKLDAIRDDIAATSPDQVIWIDDDIAFDPATLKWLAGMDKPIHHVSPNSNHGLTRNQLEDAYAFIAAHSAGPLPPWAHAVTYPDTVKA